MVTLTVMVVGYFSMAEIEIRSARAHTNSLRAQLAAESGLEHAIERIRRQIGRPEAGGAAFTTWAYYPDLAGNPHNYYTAMTVGRPDTLNSGAPWLSTDNTLWLFSGADPVDPTDPSAVPSGPAADPDNIPADDALSVDINRRGRVRPAAAPDDEVEVRVPWIDFEQEVIGKRIHIYRFAYWIDDESSRIDVAVSGNVDEDGKHLREDGEDVSEIPLFDLDGADLQAAVEGKPFILTPSSIRQLLTDEDAIPRELDFLTTAYSRGFDVIQYAPEAESDSSDGSDTSDTEKPHRGKRRMNLNFDGHIDASEDPEDRVNRLADWMEFGAPDFFEKGAPAFWPSSKGTAVPNFSDTLSPDIRREQIQTIAASIIDLRDEDIIPTQPASLPDPAPDPLPGAPVLMIQEVDRPVFFGAENCPVINEVHLIWNCRGEEDNYRARSAVDRKTESNGLYTYTIPVTWRFELWNMTDKEIPAQAYSVRSYNNMQITASAFGFGSDPIPPDSELVIDLNEGEPVGFAPGEIRVFDHTVTYTSTGPNDQGQTWSDFIKSKEPDGHQRTSYVLFDPETKKWLSSTNYLQQDEAPSDGLNPAGPGNKGNSQGSKINDPRMQPLRRYFEGGDHYWQAHRDWASNKPGKIGFVNNRTGSRNFDFQNFDFWIDRPQWDNSVPTDLPEPVLRGGGERFASAAVLGHVFDPAWVHPRGRGGGTSGSFACHQGNVTPFHGGGTLRIGQPDGKTSWAANSWVLLDLFGASADEELDSEEFLPAAWRGKVNVNCPKSVVLKDGSEVSNLDLLFRLPSLGFAPPSGNGENFDTGILFEAVQARLAMGGDGGVGGTVQDWTYAKPFFSVGEMSESKVWIDPDLYQSPERLVEGPADAPEELQLKFIDRSDRGREEIFARACNLMTTKGNAFRIVVAGQYASAPVSDPANIRVHSTRYLESSVGFPTSFNEESGELEGVGVEEFYRALK